LTKHTVFLIQIHLKPYLPVISLLRKELPSCLSKVARKSQIRPEAYIQMFQDVTVQSLGAAAAIFNANYAYTKTKTRSVPHPSLTCRDDLVVEGRWAETIDSQKFWQIDDRDEDYL
jgi:hypothetical protein